MKYHLSYENNEEWNEFKRICQKKKITMVDMIRQFIKIFIKAGGDNDKIADAYKQLNKII